jgi:hypothetical protein
MAAFCSTCGKPLAPGANFCKGCGAPSSTGTAPPAPSSAQPVQASPNPNPAAPVKTGSSVLKILLVLFLLGSAMVVMAGVGVYFYGKRKLAELRQNPRIAALLPSSLTPSGSGEHSASSGGDAAAALLTKEEVGGIIGVPVTEIEMSGRSDATYKTATMGLDASIEVERKNDEADAIQSFNAARTVTKGMFGGKAEPVTGVGDEALYGAFNVLYVRKGDTFMTIRPPNLQQAAQMASYTNLTSQPMGSDAQKEAMDKFQKTMKGDPNQSALAKPDAVSGATDLIGHAATERGGEYETKARDMARQMAEKVLAKI